MDCWLKNIDKGLVTGIVIIDLCKAFDTVDIFLAKLPDLEITAVEDQWFQAFSHWQVTNHNQLLLMAVYLTGSLTHWKKWYPSLFSSLKWPPILQQNTDFSAQNGPFFVIKHWLFSSKSIPLFFAVKHWLFSPNEPLFHRKTLDIKITPFFSKFTEVCTKIPFSRKMRILNFLKKYPFIREF